MCLTCSAWLRESSANGANLWSDNDWRLLDRRILRSSDTSSFDRLLDINYKQLVKKFFRTNLSQKYSKIKTLRDRVASLGERRLYCFEGSILKMICEGHVSSSAISRGCHVDYSDPGYGSYRGPGGLLTMI